MFSFKEMPYALLLLTAITLSLVFISLPFAQVNFQDITMFTIPLAILAWIFPLFLSGFWLLYRITKKYLYSLSLTRIHILITISTTVLAAAVLYIGITPVQPASQSSYDSVLNDKQQLIGNITRILFMLFVCGQCTYIANILWGLFRKQ